jgi:hypothetical protein
VSLVVEIIRMVLCRVWKRAFFQRNIQHLAAILVGLVTPAGIHRFACFVTSASPPARKARYFIMYSPPSTLSPYNLGSLPVFVVYLLCLCVDMFMCHQYARAVEAEAEHHRVGVQISTPVGASPPARSFHTLLAYLFCALCWWWLLDVGPITITPVHFGTSTTVLCTYNVLTPPPS